VWEVVATLGLCALVMARHVGNIKRLLTRGEHALS
jgi:glycerol-3-phosphate acyltransferase PlsY